MLQRTVPRVLPPVLSQSDYVKDEDHFQTTTGTTHDYKPHGGQLSHPLYKKAAGSWKCHYVEDTIAKVCLGKTWGIFSLGVGVQFLRKCGGWGTHWYLIFKITSLKVAIEHKICAPLQQRCVKDIGNLLVKIKHDNNYNLSFLR